MERTLYFRVVRSHFEDLHEFSRDHSRPNTEEVEKREKSHLARQNWQGKKKGIEITKNETNWYGKLQKN